MGANKKTFGTRTDKTAFRAGLRSHIRADSNYFNSIPNSFVTDEVLQLVETPSIQPEVESLASASFPYSFDVLHNNSSSVAICNNLFADDMIPISLETPLPARNGFKPLLGRTSAFALESCSQTLEFEPISFNLISAKKLPIACYSNMVYSDIYPKKSIARINWGIDVSGKSYMQEHSLLSVQDEQGSLVIPINIFKVVFWNGYGNVNSLSDSREPNFIFRESESSLIKGKRHNLLEGRFRAFSGLDRFKSLRSYPIGVYNELGRQIKKFSCLIVAKMVKLVSVADIGFKALISNVRYCFRILPHSFKKQSISWNFQFYGCNGFHSNSVDVLLYKLYAQMSSGIGGWQFLSTLKSGVSLPYAL